MLIVLILCIVRFVAGQGKCDLRNKMEYLCTRVVRIEPYYGYASLVEGKCIRLQNLFFHVKSRKGDRRGDIAEISSLLN